MSTFKPDFNKGISTFHPGAAGSTEQKFSLKRKSTLTQQQKNNKRQRASPDQLQVLKTEFEVNPTPNAGYRRDIGKRIDMTERSVQIWFQNTRAKNKYDIRRLQDGTNSDSSHSSQSSSSSSLSPNFSSASSILPGSVFQNPQGFPVFSESAENSSGNREKPVNQYIYDSTGNKFLNPGAVGGKNRNMKISCSSLSVGNWCKYGVHSITHGSDLMINYVFSKQTFVYTIFINGKGFRIQYPSKSIKCINFIPEKNSWEKATLSLTLSRHPSFYSYDKTKSLWISAEDFSETKQFSTNLLHEIKGPGYEIYQQVRVLQASSLNTNFKGTPAEIAQVSSSPAISISSDLPGFNSLSSGLVGRPMGISHAELANQFPYFANHSFNLQNNISFSKEVVLRTSLNSSLGVSANQNSSGVRNQNPILKKHQVEKSVIVNTVLPSNQNINKNIGLIEASYGHTDATDFAEPHENNSNIEGVANNQNSSVKLNDHMKSNESAESFDLSKWIDLPLDESADTLASSDSCACTVQKANEEPYLEKDSSEDKVPISQNFVPNAYHPLPSESYLAQLPQTTFAFKEYARPRSSLMTTQTTNRVQDTLEISAQDQASYLAHNSNSSSWAVSAWSPNVILLSDSNNTFINNRNHIGANNNYNINSLASTNSQNFANTYRGCYGLPAALQNNFVGMIDGSYQMGVNGYEYRMEENNGSQWTGGNDSEWVVNALYPLENVRAARQSMLSEQLLREYMHQMMNE